MWQAKADAIGAGLAALACVLALAWLQFSYPDLLDGDSYFHTRASQQLAEHGIAREFPQAAFSTWRDHYSDKDFLFHVLLIPLMSGTEDLLAAGKLAVVLFDLFVFASFVTAMRSLGIRFGAAWVLLFMSASPWLIQHLVVVRPHLLALGLVVLELAALLTGRWKTLALLSGLHVISHSSFVLLPGLPVALAISHRLRAERMPTAAFVAVGCGLVVANLGHPYFPNNLSLAYDQIVEVARGVWGTGPGVPRDLFGSELLGLSFWGFVSLSPAWAPGFLGLAVLARSRKLSRVSHASLTLALVALGLLFLSFLSMRFFAFFVPVACLLAGSVFTELAEGRRLADLLRERASLARWSVAFLLFAILMGQLSANVVLVRDQIAQVRIPSVYRESVAYLDRVAQRDDVVFHAVWQPFSWLYHFRPQGRYIAGLDPIFFYRFDEQLFGKALAIYRGESADPAPVLARHFDARWVYVAKLPRTAPMRELLARSKGVRRVYADPVAEVYQVLVRKVSDRVTDPRGE